MILKHKCDNCPFRGEHQEMGFRPFGVCTWETNLIEAEKTYKAERCPYFRWRITVKLKEPDKPEYVVPVKALMQIMKEKQEE